jgi:hypothetical protein
MVVMCTRVVISLLTLCCSNSQSIVTPLNKIIMKGFSMFQAKAYLHQYQKHSLTEEEFETSFIQLEHVLEMYKKL